VTETVADAIECTFGVEDVDATRASVVAAGGRILMEKFTIPGVGHLIAFQDPGGNPVSRWSTTPPPSEPDATDTLVGWTSGRGRSMRVGRCWRHSSSWSVISGRCRR